MKIREKAEFGYEEYIYINDREHRPLYIFFKRAAFKAAFLLAVDVLLITNQVLG